MDHSTTTLSQPHRAASTLTSASYEKERPVGQMAWDSKSARRRQNSNATTRPAQTRQSASSELFVPKSAHVSDAALQPFLAPLFDPVDFLNASLPSFSPIESSQRGHSHDVSLAELSTQAQTLLSNLSAHTTRLTNVLTQLTDEILRSGSKLAYEVEVLQGETLGLSEALTDGLQDDISNFVPDGLEDILTKRPSRSVESGRRLSTVSMPKTPLHEEAIVKAADPAYITQLRTLTSVRNRLDTVIKTFGDAMSWTFPPSEVSVSSSFLSVSAPELGSEASSTEEKGQQVSKQLRDEIANLLIGSKDPLDCIEAAARRVEELKDLSKVWKGTAEEKGRTKFVEALAKMVEDRHRDLLREAQQDGRAMHDVGISTTSAEDLGDSKPQGGYGFINQLQKMRGGL